MQIHSEKDTARRLGEYLLKTIAAANPMQALHLGMSDLPGGDIPTWALAEVLDAGTRLPRMNVFRMPGGDLFMFAEKFPGDTLRQLRALIAGRVAGMEADDVGAVCRIYDVPGDAAPLRRLVKSYITGAPRPPYPTSTATPIVDAALPATPAEPPPSHLAAVAGAGLGPEGPLTPQRLREVQDLIEGIEIAPFIHRQPVWRKDGRWTMDYVEYFFDINGLRQQHFPKLEFDASETIFLQFCQVLDEFMLVHLLTDHAARHRRIGINLSITTVYSPAFDTFVDSLPDRERRNLICELHWLEVLQDIHDGGRSVRSLLETGCSLAMDRISVPVLPYLNFLDSRFDYVKVRFDRQSLAQIQPESVSALRRCPPEKVVLTACDDRRAVALGDTLRIGGFQGRLLDEMMANAP